MKVSAWASLAASTTSSSLAVGRPKRMFSMTVVLNRKVSWSTMPICSRNDSVVTSRTSLPSMRTAPPVTS